MLLQACKACRHDRQRRVSPVLAVWLAALLLSAMVATAAAAEPAGRVIFSSGDVTAVDADGVERALARDDDIHPGDTVRTAARSMADLRMRDNALVSLDPETRFAVERYGLENGAGSAVMRFLSGALRTITGTIGKNEADTYQMHTPVATIGVRGTEYALHLCDADCASEDRPAGLYGRVDDGTISVTNDAASALMTQGDYFYVADSDVAPERLVRPPDGILGIGPGTADSLADSSTGLIDSTSTLLLGEDSLLDSTSDTLLSTTDTLLDTSGDLLDTGGSLLDSGGGLLDDSGGSDSLLGDTDADEEDGGLLDLDGDGDLL